MAVRIYRVEIGAAMNAKINAKHGVTQDEVREVCFGNHRAAWHDHPEHGRRLLVRGTTTRGRRLLVILHPVDPESGHWRLKTALTEKGG